MYSSIHHPLFCVFATFAFFAASTSFASAAQIHATGLEEDIGVGDTFLVSYLLDSEGGSLNALEGTLRYPHEMLAVREMRDGNTFVSFWLERPVAAEGIVRFAGVVPGGFAGSSGEVLSVVFEALQSGEVSFLLSDARILLNNGTGTPEVLSLAPHTLRIGSSGTGKKVGSLAESDRTPPEAFMPEVATDPNLFEGRHFLVFATQDKASGIARYEVREKNPLIFWRKGTFETVESPYVLRDQKLRSAISVRAYDVGGNVQEVHLAPASSFAKTVDIFLALLYGVGILILLLAIRRKAIRT